MKELKKDTKIALLMGGPGSERDVSIASGNGVLEALRSEGFTQVTPVIVDTERPAIPEGTELCYNIIHGTYGEDGGIESSETVYEDGEATFLLDDAHYLYWNDITEDAGADMAFEETEIIAD